MLSNTHKVEKTSIACWDWHKEEIAILEGGSQVEKIQLRPIKDKELAAHIERFEACMDHVRHLDYLIALKSYGYFLRLGLTKLKANSFDYLLERLARNQELEIKIRKGGYKLSDLGENNPKAALKTLLLYLKTGNSKQKELI